MGVAYLRSDKRFIFPTFGLLIMTITYLQSLGKGSKAGILVMLRQNFLVLSLVLVLAIILMIKEYKTTCK